MTDVTAAPRAPIAAACRTEILEGMTPADVVAQLAAAVPERTGDDYLIYERHGRWTLAVGARTSIELDRDECRIRDGQTVVAHPWSGRPAHVLAAALESALVDGEPAFGWIAFEFGAHRHGVFDKLPVGAPLARIFTPA